MIVCILKSTPGPARNWECCAALFQVSGSKASRSGMKAPRGRRRRLKVINKIFVIMITIPKTKHRRKAWKLKIVMWLTHGSWKHESMKAWRHESWNFKTKQQHPNLIQNVAHSYIYLKTYISKTWVNKHTTRTNATSHQRNGYQPFILSVWIPPICTCTRVLCYLWNYHGDTKGPNQHVQVTS